MTEYEKWIEENNIEREPSLSYNRGRVEYAWFGKSMFNREKDIGSLSKEEFTSFYSRNYREEAVHTFSFAIITSEVVEALRPLGPFLEVGSGTGYLAWELNQVAGLACLPTDPEPYTGQQQARKIWLESEKLTGSDAVRTYSHRFPELTLLMSWPSLSDSWAYHTLREFRKLGGQRLVYIGEHGGCCADEAFFEELEKWWEEVDSIPIPSWHGIRDGVWVYRKKSVEEYEYARNSIDGEASKTIDGQSSEG